MFLLMIFGVKSLKVDNYLTDEVNKNSSLYKEMSFFNENFGGIKPITFKVPINDDIQLSQILDASLANDDQTITPTSFRKICGKIKHLFYYRYF